MRDLLCSVVLSADVRQRTPAASGLLLKFPATLGGTHNAGVEGSIPSLSTISFGSVLDTSVTFYTDDMGNTLAANGLSAHSKRLLSWSKNPKS